MLDRALSIINAIFIAQLIAASALAQPTLIVAKEAPLESQLVDIDSEGRMVFQQSEKRMPLPGNAIVRWSSNQATMPGSSVALADGSWLAGQLQWPTDRRVRVVSKWFEAFELEIDSLRAVTINPSPSWPVVQRLQAQMLKVSGSQDVLWKRNGESVSGIVTIELKKSIDPFSPDRAAWSFKSAAANTASEIPQADVAGVTFSPILRRVTPTNSNAFVVNLNDGSRLIVKEFKRRADNRIEVRLASDVLLVSLDEADQFVLSIAQISGTPTGVQWLSDMEPARYRLLDSGSRVAWPLGRNRDLHGEPLFDSRGQAIDHALVVHSPAQVAYRAGGQSARLLATIEILQAPSGGPNKTTVGSAQCQVHLGRNGQLTSAWQSEILRPNQPPVNVDIDVSQAQLIVLLVDQADMGTLGDHVLWRDARIVTE